MAIVKIMTEGNNNLLTEDGSCIIAEKEILLKTDPVSQIESVRVGKPFYANCQTFSLTVLDMLIERGVDPADIELAVVRILPKGFAWVYENGKWGIDKGEMHQVVVWDDMVLDNRFDRVVVREDLNREYGW
jgi:hypothetical protein